MKKLILVSAVLLSLTGCFGGKKTATRNDKPKITNIDKLPKWILEPDVKDGVAAVGMAQPSRGGLQFQIPKAETDARANIATKIQSTISRVTKQSLREANVNGVNDVEDVFTQASKEVVADIPLSGAKRINMHQDKDGTLYIHMKLTTEDYTQYLKNSQKIYEERLQKANLSRENLNRAQEATKALFEELEEERNK